MATARPRVLYCLRARTTSGKCVQCGVPFIGRDATKAVRKHVADNPGHVVAVQQVTTTDYWSEG